MTSPQKSHLIAIRDSLRAEGWMAWKVGVADLIALRAGSQPRLIQVTTGLHQFERFTEVERTRLVARAEQAGAEPQLVWWPHGGRSRWIDRSEWP